METGTMPVDEIPAAAEDKWQPAHAEEWKKYGKLTERERAVLHYVASGFTAPEIGEKLLISAKTVDTYKQRINQKLSLSHRSDYVAFALKLGLLA
jgi:DNA-binding NarL/FixJ family response regulator